MPSVLITGANRGIGLAFARLYAEDGWRVHACCREPDAADALKALAGDICCHRLDVTDATQRTALASALAGEALDVVINNAGIYTARENVFGDIDTEAWAAAMKVNVFAPLHVAEVLADNLVAADNPVLANISSKMGSIGALSSDGSIVYRSTKAALNMTMACVAKTLGPRGVTTIMLHPGWVRSDMGGSGADLSTEESAGALHKLIARTKPSDNGCFFNYDGAALPW